MMLGLIINEFEPKKFLMAVSKNTDKNYLTPLEIAALADNQLITITVESVRGLLDSLPVIFNENDWDDQIIEEAVNLALIARRGK